GGSAGTSRAEPLAGSPACDAAGSVRADVEGTVELGPMGQGRSARGSESHHAGEAATSVRARQEWDAHVAGARCADAALPAQDVNRAGQFRAHAAYFRPRRDRFPRRLLYT